MEKLLIIEDDTDLREGLEFMFQAEQYEVLSVDTVKKAIQCMRQTNIQGIILDCNLPDGNGFELCKKIRKKSEVPIIMLTARDSELDEVKALELGVNDYMSKPFSVAVLKARVKNAKKNRSYHIEVREYCNGFIRMQNNKRWNRTRIKFHRIQTIIIFHTKFRTNFIKRADSFSNMGKRRAVC